MNISRLEQETVITFNEEEKTATVYTYNRKVKRKLAAASADRPDEVQQTGNDEYGGLTFEIPKKWVKVNPSRILSEEEKAAKAEAARKNLHNVQSKSF